MSDKFDEMANEAVRAYDTLAATRKRVSALVRREVDRARADAGVAGEIRAERERQKSVEGWTEAHDDQHDQGELAKAAACYAQFSSAPKLTPPKNWPWLPLDWKPKDPRRDLIRAAALIVAEIERLDRAAAIRARGSKEKSDAE